MTKRFGFTLAEVLITLAIIGVVAAMTIPTLIANYQQKSWDTAASVFNRRLGEALKVMNSNSSLAGYTTTQSFVDELGKHIKIVKTCASDKLTDCFASEIATSGNPIDTTTLQKSKKLNATGQFDTETIGVQFADGVSALIAYNKNTKQDPFASNDIVQISGDLDGKSVTVGTNAVSILYDVSGLKTPNHFGSGKDIRGINLNLHTGVEAVLVENPGTIDCSDSSSTNYSYCGSSPSGWPSDSWAGASYTCAQQGLRLPTTAELQKMAADGGSDIPASGWYWSSTSAYMAMNGQAVNIADGTMNEVYKNQTVKALCIK
ncbi:prepilin-type N-terminal cleavage/methylation domain-containing protein [bacterium]|nr:prepilin-type N-terminal cleavage/methylation domain-containing protein [bacterium]